MATVCMKCGNPMDPAAGGGSSDICPACRAAPAAKDAAPRAPSFAPAPRTARRFAAPRPAAESGAHLRERPANLAIGEVFGQSLSLWSGDLGPFLLLTVIVYLPLILYTLWMVYVGPETVTVKQADVYNKVTQYGGILFNSLVTAVVVFRVFERLRGKSPPIEETVRKGLGRLLPATWTAILSAVLGAAPMVPGLVILNTAGRDTGAGTMALGGILAIGGTILSIIVFTSLYVGVAASVVEGCNGWPALKRSLALTKGSRSRIFSILFLFGIFGAVFGAVVGNFAPWRANLVLMQGYVLLIASLSAVFATVIYYRLRSAKEGINIEDLAGIFD